MELYDELIREVMTSVRPDREWAYDPGEVCRQTDSGTLILSKDSAFEFGGSALPAVNGIFFTTKQDFGDRVLLMGNDIADTRTDAPFARISVIRLEEQNEEDEGFYRQLKDIEFVKYHIFPEGCLLRLSPESRREQIRIGKQAVKSGLSLKNIGFAFLEAYKKIPGVKAAEVIYITDKQFDYRKLSALTEKASAVTSSLNRIFDGLEISCDTCELKAVCDEVEGLRQLHFGKDDKNART